MDSNQKDNAKFQAALEQLAREGDAGARSGRRRRILKALQRIDSGTYGICADCGCAIDEERLEIIPEATHCVGCQRLREQYAESCFNTATEAMNGG